MHALGGQARRGRRPARAATRSTGRARTSGRPATRSSSARPGRRRRRRRRHQPGAQPLPAAAAPRPRLPRRPGPQPLRRGAPARTRAGRRRALLGTSACPSCRPWRRAATACRSCEAAVGAPSTPATASARRRGTPLPPASRQRAATSSPPTSRRAPTAGLCCPAGSAPRAAALAVLEGDADDRRASSASTPTACSPTADEGLACEIAKARHAEARALAAAAQAPAPPPTRWWRLTTSPRTGIPIMIGVIAAMFATLFIVGEVLARVLTGAVDGLDLAGGHQRRARPIFGDGTVGPGRPLGRGRRHPGDARRRHPVHPHVLLHPRAGGGLRVHERRRLPQRPHHAPLRAARPSRSSRSSPPAAATCRPSSPRARSPTCASASSPPCWPRSRPAARARR